MAETQFGSSPDDLDKIFDMDDEKRIKIAGIRSRIRNPDPNVKGDRVTCRVLFYKNPDKSTELFKKVSGEQFETTAVFLNVEDVEQPGIELDLSVPKTRYQAIDRELTNKGLSWNDLPGHVLILTADFWTSAPRDKRSKQCTKCTGRGCDFCTVTGNGNDSGMMTGLAPPTRYDAVIRDDMAGIGGKKSGSTMEF